MYVGDRCGIEDDSDNHTYSPVSVRFNAWAAKALGYIFYVIRPLFVYGSLFRVHMGNNGSGKRGDAGFSVKQ